MRRFNAFLFVLIVVMLLVSCSENPGTTTMKLVLSTQVEEGSRTLFPTDSTLIDVTKYTVSGVGPNGKTFTRNTDNSSVEIEGVKFIHLKQLNYYLIGIISFNFRWYKIVPLLWVSHENES